MKAKTTDQKLAHARTKIREWERRMRRAANKLAAYRAVETRLARKLTKEIAESSKPTTGRKFDFAE